MIILKDKGRLGNRMFQYAFARILAEPNGDILAMNQVSRLIKDDGFLFLSVPIGEDKLVWNAHRIYGEKRFGKLIDGWDIMAVFGGFSEDKFHTDNSYTYQPVFVLKKNIIALDI